MLQAAIDYSQALVTGQVRVKLYKGNVTVIGRTSPYSLYDQDLVTFEEGKVAYRPPRRGGLHQAERAPPAGAGQARREGRLSFVGTPMVKLGGSL